VLVDGLLAFVGVVRAPCLDLALTGLVPEVDTGGNGL